MTHRIRVFSSLLLVLSFLFNGGYAIADKPELMQAKVYSVDQSIDLAQYWVSEKYDGVRAYWDGKRLLTRRGNTIHAPDWFIADFPEYPMDGELWAGRENFEFVSGLIRKKPALDGKSNIEKFDKEWQSVSYMVFDLPEQNRPFDDRNEFMQCALPELGISWLKPAPQIKFKSEEALLDYLNKLVTAGAEGLMLHNGSAYYAAKRTGDLLKLKPTLDSEAIVIGYTSGKGKYTGQVGALEVEWRQGSDTKLFRLGTGLTDELRRNPPAIGAEVTFEYSGLTKNGIPRFARFKRVRQRH